MQLRREHQLTGGYRVPASPVYDGDFGRHDSMLRSCGCGILFEHLIVVFTGQSRAWMLRVLLRHWRLWALHWQLLHDQRQFMSGRLLHRLWACRNLHGIWLLWTGRRGDLWRVLKTSFAFNCNIAIEASGDHRVDLHSVDLKGFVPLVNQQPHTGILENGVGQIYPYARPLAFARTG